MKQVLPKANNNWLIRVTRKTPNSSSEYVSDKMYIQAITEVVDLKLAYVDYDLFSDRQLNQLINEFKRLIEIYPVSINEISKIIKFLEKAVECNEKILFDPFRESTLGLNIFFKST